MTQMDLKSTENSAEKHNRGQTERDGMKFIAAIGFDINSRSHWTRFLVTVIYSL